MIGSGTSPSEITATQPYSGGFSSAYLVGSASEALIVDAYTAGMAPEVIAALEGAGFTRVRVVDVLSPPWTSDWISADGRRKLAAYGIAPPPDPVASVRALASGEAHANCPRCGSADTELISEFGSTPCKALHRCRACLEPFDRFKCL